MTHIEQRADPAGVWTADNPVLFRGEVGWELNTGKAKLGDGVTAWYDLPYAVAPGGAVTSVAGKTGAVVLVKADVGLSNVQNTADMDKPVSVAQQEALDDKAPIDSPAFIGTPTAPTPATSDDDTSIATTEFVKNALDALVAGTGNSIVIGGVRIQWGLTANIAMGGNAAITFTYNFPFAFSAPATAVLLSVRTGMNNKLVASVTVAPTASSFDAAIKTTDGSTSNLNPALFWLAFGPA